MQREDVIKVLMMIQAAYPNYRPQDKTIAVNTWYMMLKDYECQVVEAALKMYIATDTSGFAPAIGQIIDKIKSVTSPNELNGMEAWSLVSNALRNGYYGAEQEFEKLPFTVQKAVGSPDNLRNWAQSDSKSIETVIQSNFMRTYETELKRQNEELKIPEDVRQLISSISVGKQRLIESGGKKNED
jgi:hypothetical protein